MAPRQLTVREILFGDDRRKDAAREKAKAASEGLSQLEIVRRLLGRNELTEAELNLVKLSQEMLDAREAGKIGECSAALVELIANGTMVDSGRREAGRVLWVHREHH
jgi:hypothetical protein